MYKHQLERTLQVHNSKTLDRHISTPAKIGYPHVAVFLRNSQQAVKCSVFTRAYFWALRKFSKWQLSKGWLSRQCVRRLSSLRHRPTVTSRITAAWLHSYFTALWLLQELWEFWFLRVPASKWLFCGVAPCSLVEVWISCTHLWNVDTFL
jgi:hypothetical protein